MVTTKPVDVDRLAMEQSQVARPTDLKKLVTECGAVLHGHFRLASGRHSDIYVEKFRVLERPTVLEKVCSSIVEHFKDSRPELVAGPSTGGMIVAYEVARQLGINAVYVEAVEKVRVLRRGGHIPEGTRVLLVDDVLTTGISLQEVLPVIQNARAELIGLGVLIDRSENTIDFGAGLYAATRFEAKTYPEAELPDWLAEIPISVPGTRALGI
jgi:orotate phosphoribosyltransferase